MGDRSISPANRRPAILIVEDDRDLGALMRLALTGAGYRAVLRPGHADALAVLTAMRFALVIADTAGDTPVVICTAHQPRVCTGYRERGFAGLLPKPFDLETLFAVARLADADASPARAPLRDPGAVGGDGCR